MHCSKREKNYRVYQEKMYSNVLLREEKKNAFESRSQISKKIYSILTMTVKKKDKKDIKNYSNTILISW
jgi:hypothetical protein